MYMAPKLITQHLVSSTTFIFLLLHLLITRSYSAPQDVATTLLKFKESLKDDSNALSSWQPSTQPCFGSKNNWAGLICSKGGSVWGLRLENMGLSGTIDVDSLAQLPRMRSFSIMNNNFGGPLPDFRQLRPLKGLFLSHNNFEGTIAPNAFEGLRRLRKVNLSFNKFSGDIPSSLTSLTKLVELKLEGNQFQGPIPDFATLTSLQVFNASNNQLQGPIPPSLTKFDNSVFQGNKELCGFPLSACSPSTQNSMAPPTGASPPPPVPTSEKPIPIIAIIVGVVLAMTLALAVYVMVLRSRRNRGEHEDHSELGAHATGGGGRHHRGLAARKAKAATAAAGKRGDVESPDDDDGGSTRSTTSAGGGRARGGGGDQSQKLTFIKRENDKRERFDLPDLLKASAEILGSGCFGSSYKATLNNGNTVVVKRFKQMNNVGREEFQEHMRRLGKLSHPNLLPLVAYYYRKEEKLFITDPVQKGSLAVLLHGQTRGKPTLDWPTRLKVIKGAARGLSYLYKELPCLVAPHGHLKSSNVLLTGSSEPVLSDYGLIPLINQESVQEHMVAYKSPEYFNNSRITRKTDVWALGILIIETLTGKLPAGYLQQGSSEVNMTTWVDSVVHEGFDRNMGQTRNSEGEMQKLLKIGMDCCESDVEMRLDIKEACARIEEVRERDNDDDFYSTYASTEAGDLRSSRGLSDDFTVIIN